MPRFRSIGFISAATALATSRTICAPMFSNLSSSSISFATVTPSLVMRGAPKLLSRTTLRPLGPSVTFTALARMSTPRSIFSRASAEKRTSLAAMLRYSFEFLSGQIGGGLLLQHAHDVALLHDEEIFAVDLHFGARPFAEQNLVTRLDVERHEL